MSARNERAVWYGLTVGVASRAKNRQTVLGKRVMATSSAEAPHISQKVLITATAQHQQYFSILLDGYKGRQIMQNL